MDIRSLPALTQLVERAEATATELRGLATIEPDVQIPDFPLPFSLDSTADWLAKVEECRRKPRLARSKHILEGHGIETASIPAAVLESSEAIAELIQEIDSCPAAFRAAALSALGRALTKDVHDARTIVDQFSEAAIAVGDLEEQAADHSWIYKLAVESIAESPGDAAEIIQRTEEVLQHSKAAAQHGMLVGAFETLGDAQQALSNFNDALEEWHRRLADEGLSPASDEMKDHDLQTATAILVQNVERLENDKHLLIQQTNALASQLESVGRSCDIDATTVAELRARLPELQAALEDRRRTLRQSLGKDVFQVVELLAKGELPSSTRVDDTKLGKALRKAVDGGYRLRLEVPRED